MENLFTEKFTAHLKQALLRAQALAVFNGRAATAAHEISPTDLLESLWQEKGSIAAEILQKGSRLEKTALPETSEILLPRPRSRPTAVLGREAAALLVKAVQVSHQHGHKYVGTEHLLGGLTLLRTAAVRAWWQKRGINLAELEKNLQIVLESTSKFPDLTAVFRSPVASEASQEEKLRSALEYFGRELTNEEVQRDIDPVIGREREINRLVHVLCRRYKNNPLLLGEAGVGKTAIVEGLAKKIMQGEVPPILANKKIYAIDLGAVVAGTIYRGEFEARFKNLLEAAEHVGNVILFIDEIHTVIGAGSASGSLDAANMLKPALARGKISLIGATTTEEYKKHIETDSALERRLQPIIIDEPNEAETRAVLAGIRANYERFHKVTITDEAIVSAVRLSNRYLTEKLQPDKAIDLIDEAAARVKVERSEAGLWPEIRKIEAALGRVTAAKKEAVQKENYSQAIIAREQENELRLQLDALYAEVREEDSEQAHVLALHVLLVVSDLTKIPLGELDGGERTLLSRLEEQLGQKIIGQARALAQIANLIRRGRTDVGSPAKPLASFMFLGPSGVGKTETAKQLAALLFNDERALIRLDMSEFSEGFTVSRLIGSPAGYVGYRDSNKFTDLVRRRPHSVILLDEIEKAHPEIFNLLLQVLEEGELADATGRRVNFRNTIIIMTSNLGWEQFRPAVHLGFDSPSESEIKINWDTVETGVLKEVRNFFREEFLNRLDALVVFNPLTSEHIKQIIDLYTQEINRRLQERNITFTLTARGREEIARQSFSPRLGARGLRRFFQNNIESEIANLLLKNKDNTAPLNVQADADKAGLTFKIENTKLPAV